MNTQTRHENLTFRLPNPDGRPPTFTVTTAASFLQEHPGHNPALHVCRLYTGEFGDTEAHDVRVVAHHMDDIVDEYNDVVPNDPPWRNALDVSKLKLEQATSLIELLRLMTDVHGNWEPNAHELSCAEALEKAGVRPEEHWHRP